MYLPNQINACRAGFYSRLNWEHRGKKKIIKARSVITMVSNPASPIQAVQKKCHGWVRIWENVFEVYQAWKSPFYGYSRELKCLYHLKLDTYNLITRFCQYKKLLLKRGHYLRNFTSKGGKNSRHSYTIQDIFLLPVVNTKLYIINPSCIEWGKPVHITNTMYPKLEQYFRK